MPLPLQLLLHPWPLILASISRGHNIMSQGMPQMSLVDCAGFFSSNLMLTDSLRVEIPYFMVRNDKITITFTVLRLSS